MNFHNQAHMLAFRLAMLKEPTTIHERNDILSRLCKGPSDISRLLQQSQYSTKPLQYQILSYYRYVITEQTARDVDNWHTLISDDPTSCFHQFHWFNFVMSIQCFIYEPAMEIPHYLKVISAKFVDSPLVGLAIESFKDLLFQNMEKSLKPLEPDALMLKMKDFVLAKPSRIKPTDITYACKAGALLMHEQSQARLTNYHALRYWHRLMDTSEEEEELERDIKSKSESIEKIQNLIEHGNLQKESVMELVIESTPMYIDRAKICHKLKSLLNVMVDIVNECLCFERNLTVGGWYFIEELIDNCFEAESILDDLFIDNGTERIVVQIQSTVLLKHLFYKLYDNQDPSCQLSENKVMLSYIKKLISNLIENNSNMGVITNYYYSLFIKVNDLKDAKTIPNPNTNVLPIKILGKEVEFIEIDHDSTELTLRWMIFYSITKLVRSQHTDETQGVKEDEFGLKSLLYTTEDLCDVSIPKHLTSVVDQYLPCEKYFDVEYLEKKPYDLIQSLFTNAGTKDDELINHKLISVMELEDLEDQLDLRLEGINEKFVFSKLLLLKSPYFDKDQLSEYYNEAIFLKYFQNYNSSRSDYVVNAPKLFYNDVFEFLSDYGDSVCIGCLVVEQFIKGRRTQLSDLSSTAFEKLKVQNGILNSLDIDHFAGFKNDIVIEEDTEDVYMINWEHALFRGDDGTGMNT